QHAVPQKFQPLIVGGGDFAFVGKTGMGQGNAQQRRVLEMIVENLLQFFGFMGRHGGFFLSYSGWQRQAHAWGLVSRAESAVCMVPHRSLATQVLAWRMAFLMPLALLEPWALMTGLAAPSSGAPPTSS